MFVVNIYQCVERNQDFGMIKNAFIRVVDSAKTKSLYTLIYLKIIQEQQLYLQVKFIETEKSGSFQQLEMQREILDWLKLQTNIQNKQLEKRETKWLLIFQKDKK